jgi:hypothetical protein
MAGVELPNRIEAYLRAVEEELRSLPPEETLEIARELRSHIQDRMAGYGSAANVSAILKKLGEPRHIARVNLQMRMATCGQNSPRPIRAALIRSTEFGARILLTLLFSLAGYAFAGFWLFTAVAKPFAPARVGLWVLPDPTGDLSLSLVRRAADFGGQELLGWWIIPAGLVMGIGCAALTYRLNLRWIRALVTPRRSVRRLAG